MIEKIYYELWYNLMKLHLRKLAEFYLFAVVWVIFVAADA